MASNGGQDVTDYQRFLTKDGRIIYGLNIMLFGDPFIGKRSLTTRFVDDSFYDYSHYNNICLDFRIRTVTLDNNTIKLLAWDLAGMGYVFRRFKTLPHIYLRSAHCVMLTFDTTCLKSFEHLKEWVELLKTSEKNRKTPVVNNAYGDAQNIPLLVIGTKSDLLDEREVSSEVALEFATEKGLQYIETSAKTGENVEIAFISATALALNRFDAFGIERVPPGTDLKEKQTNNTKAKERQHCIIS